VIMAPPPARSNTPRDDFTGFGTLPRTTVRELAARQARLPFLRERYEPLVDRPGLTLTDLPVLGKDELRNTFPDVLAANTRGPRGAVLTGSGGTTSAPHFGLMPSDQFVDDILEVWHPLDSDDILVNLDSAGRLCSSHGFFNTLAARTGAVSVPIGGLDDDQMSHWLDMVDQIGATALNATPSHLARLLEHCEAAGRRPPGVGKVLWTGEGFSRRSLDTVRRLLPEVELHGVYGSSTTWVVGHNGPRCDPNTFHVLPYQHVELLSGSIVVTCVHPNCLNPIVRYRIGDRAEPAYCPCGRTGPAFRVLGRDDTHLKFLGVLLSPEQIVAVVRDLPGVSDAQVALFDRDEPGERMEIRIVRAATPEGEPTGEADQVAAQVRQLVLDQIYKLADHLRVHPEAFTVRITNRLSVNDRTRKTPPLVVDDHIDA
jgi:phenylacetate-coenzyme A ligase PaaK-like adenylate-forming protein